MPYYAYGARGAKYECDTRAEAVKAAGARGRVVTEKGEELPSKIASAIRKANAAARHWKKLVDGYEAKHGADEYRWVSGGLQEHWPQDAKRRVRDAIHKFQEAQQDVRQAFVLWLPGAGWDSAAWDTVKDKCVRAGSYGIGRYAA